MKFVKIRSYEQRQLILHVLAYKVFQFTFPNALTVMYIHYINNHGLEALMRLGATPLSTKRMGWNEGWTFFFIDNFLEISKNEMLYVKPIMYCSSSSLSRFGLYFTEGLTLVPWRKDRCHLWDAVCVSKIAPSHRSLTIFTAGSAAEYVAKTKKAKYCYLEPIYDFVPVAVEITGTWGCGGEWIHQGFGLSSYGLGLWFTLCTLGNAASVMGTFERATIQGCPL